MSKKPTGACFYQFFKTSLENTEYIFPCPTCPTDVLHIHKALMKSEKPTYYYFAVINEMYANAQIEQFFP